MKNVCVQSSAANFSDPFRQKGLAFAKSAYILASGCKWQQQGLSFGSMQVRENWVKVQVAQVTEHNKSTARITAIRSLFCCKGTCSLKHDKWKKRLSDLVQWRLLVVVDSAAKLTWHWRAPVRANKSLKLAFRSKLHKITKKLRRKSRCRQFSI